MMPRLILEVAPHPQAESARDFAGGELVIGRGGDADWQIDDPDMYISRRHCVISERDGAVVVTDASRGGLFVDGASEALGAGNSVVLEDGMRLRLGDFVFRVEIEARVDQPAEPEFQRAGGGWFDSMPPAPDPEPVRERPADLPDPFGKQRRVSARVRDKDEPPVPPRPLDDRDPFALDLKSATPTAPGQQSVGRKGYFDATAEESPRQRERSVPAPESATTADLFAAPPVAKDTRGSEKTPSAPTDDVALRAAFFRGLGLDPARIPTENASAEMEAFGRRFRALADGLLHMLRTRAAEKQRARVAQTIITSSEVNPLKFLATTDEAVAALIAARGQGYLGPDDAITDAYRDLADHQIRTWNALQIALRRMIDRFDPTEIEREMEETGILETLRAGGRSAKLWQLYEERYREIAGAAEEKFLGEIGADFRAAYEDDRRN